MNVSISIKEAFWVWLRIGVLSFGGPAGQIAIMHRILVEEKQWIQEDRFLHALNFCMMLPGPEAQQLATYLGWLMHKIRGGLIAGLLFILPGIISIMALSIVYVLLGKIWFIEAIFTGLKSAVLAIIVQSILRIGKKSLLYSLHKLIAVGSFILLFFFSVPFPFIIISAGFIGFAQAWQKRAVCYALPSHPALKLSNATYNLQIPALVCAGLWILPTLILIICSGSHSVWSEIAVFFSKMAVVTFGGAYSVLYYVAQQGVEVYGWIKPEEMLDGLAFAETTPGPLIMVVQFVAFMGAYRDPGFMPPLIAGIMGGLLATWVTFVPCFLFIFLGAPFIEYLRDNFYIQFILRSISAAVVGVILNLGLWFAVHSMFYKQLHYTQFGMSFDIPVFSSINILMFLLLVCAFILLFRFQLSVPKTLLFCSMMGILSALLIK